MKILRLMMAGVTAIFSIGCGHVPKATVNGQLRDAWGQLSDKRFIRVRGIGAAPEGVTNEVRRRGMARNAALVSARYELLAAFKGLRLSGGIRVEELIEKDSEIREVANRLVSGAEVVATEWTRGGGCVVTLQLERNKIEALIDRDRPFEPVTERERFQTRNSDRSPVLRSGRRAIDEDAADNAFLTGLLFPGAGHFVAQRPWMGAEERSRIQTRGLCYMAGTLSLVGLGAAALTAKPQPTGQPDSTGNRPNNSGSLKGLGYGILGLGFVVQVLGARDARNSVQSNMIFTVAPERGGARLHFSRRF
ncbi:hypothetical protein ACFL2T_01155 [Elusimicrobiota bacterium]